MRKFIILILSSVLAHVSYSQDSISFSIPCGDIHVCRLRKGPPTHLIADETKMTIRKTVAIVKCYNEQTAKVIIEAHRKIIRSWWWQWIKEDGERTKMYTIYFRAADAELVKSWCNTNL